ncbi:Dihydrolipoyllysine-residue acetyltransferase component of pyruvate dehydrogenase complex [Alphaproteobacteria bacterium SO-S41]|nr:Dihydrolipoyllysine-residue acetyltransferase component of pyruvate dehydrogenase complex [Alphaproteobacteria bacterium SO-S41]
MPTNILMPALSPTMEEGTLAKWLKKEGDAVKAGDVIAEIETDKATMEVEAVDEGTLAKILVPEGSENVKINTPIAVLAEEGEDASAAAPAAKPEPKADAAPEAKPEPKAEAKAEPAPKAESAKADAAPPAAAPANPGERIFASPLAKRLAGDGKLDLKLISGTGPGGRIVKADVEKALAGGPLKAADKPAADKAAPAPKAAPSAPATPAPAGSLPDARLFYKEGSYKTVPHDSMRKTVAKRLTVAKRDIPHYYLTADIEIDALLAAREAINAKSPKDGDGAYKVSVNDFVIKAVAAALIKVPDVNASWTETEMLVHQHADVGIAVALPGGLITPIIFAAETKGLVQISREAKDLAGKAKAKKLKPADYEGGSFSVSNLGMFGMRDFTAVINPPQAAILAVGAGEKRPVVRGDKLEIATVMTVRMSCDHRVIDGALGATWLAAFKGFLEDPVTMLA